MIDKAPKLYQWDFDVPDMELLSRGYSTFSVGIYQWLPKASGKGKKRSPAVTRVLGYVMEPDRVLAKAAELCRRLNDVEARADAPPDWLRKQFSITRPAGMRVERDSDEFSASQVRSMQMKVMKDLLLPAGFVVAKDASYVRRDREQIHLVNFQGSRYGHEFTVNLGFHYTFVAPKFHQRKIAIQDFHLLDCIVQQRIGKLLPGRKDVWFEYGDDRDALLERLTLCAKTSLSVFQRCVSQWRKPSAFVEEITTNPSSDWKQYVDCLSMGWIDLREGRVERAELHLSKWSDDRYTQPPREYVLLKKTIDDFRNRRGEKATACTGLEDWVTA